MTRHLSSALVITVKLLPLFPQRDFQCKTPNASVVTAFVILIVQIFSVRFALCGYIVLATTGSFNVQF